MGRCSRARSRERHFSINLFWVFGGCFVGVLGVAPGGNTAVDLSHAQLRSFTFFVAGPVTLHNVTQAGGSSGTASASKHSVYYSSPAADVDYTVQIRQPDGRWQIRGVGDAVTVRACVWVCVCVCARARLISDSNGAPPQSSGAQRANDITTLCTCLHLRPLRKPFFFSSRGL